MGEHSLYKHVSKCSPSVLSASFAPGPQRCRALLFAPAAQRRNATVCPFRPPDGVQLPGGARVAPLEGRTGLALWVQVTHVFLSLWALPAFSCVASNANCAACMATAIWGQWPVLAPPCRGAPALALVLPFPFFAPPTLRGFA